MTGLSNNLECPCLPETSPNQPASGPLTFPLLDANRTNYKAHLFVLVGGYERGAQTQSLRNSDLLCDGRQSYGVDR